MTRRSLVPLFLLGALALSALEGCGARMAAAPEAQASYPAQAPSGAAAPDARVLDGVRADAPKPAPEEAAKKAKDSDEKSAKEEPATTAKTTAAPHDLVIYTANLTMAVYQVDQGLGAVEKIATENGGYLGQKHDRAITVRVPRGRFQATLGQIDKIGDILHREISAEDVTDEHVDLEIRIKNSRAMQRRLTDLLGKASVKDALEIEKELHRVTEELERLEGKLKLLGDRVAFSTITVAFEPRGATVAATRPKLPFPWLQSLNLPSLLTLSE